MKSYRTISEAYLGSLADVYDNPDYVASPRGQQTREKLNYQFTVLYPSTDPIVTEDLERNKIIADYTNKELEWYKSGSIDVEDAKKISKFWGNLANKDGTINSNYGFQLMVDESEGNKKFSETVRTPFQWALESLLNDEHSRQAIMRINKPSHCFDGNKDFVCTMYMNFHIRENTLRATVRMRSTDLFFGIVYDLPFFAWVQANLVEHLRDKYPNLTVGALTFSSDSYHIYDRNEEAILKMLGRK